MTAPNTEATETGTAVATVSQQKGVAKRPIDDFWDLIGKLKPQIAMALPKHIDMDRMIRIILTTVQKNPDILECTRESVIACILQCAQLGLEPDGMLGHAYLIPFNDRKNDIKVCTLIVGYKGLLKLARQSGEIASISARAVHKKDVFRYNYGLKERLHHVPSGDDDPGELTHAYAIFRMKDGSHHYDVMSRREIDAIRKRSKSSEKGPWVTDYEEMAKKTVLRRASKMAPASIEDRVAPAAASDARADIGLPPAMDVDLPPADVPGIEPEQQGKRLSLGKPKEKAATPTPANDGATAEPASEPPPAKPFTMSTTRERLALLKDITDAKVAKEDVVARFGELETMSKETIAEVRTFLHGMTGEVPEPGSEG